MILFAITIYCLPYQRKKACKQNSDTNYIFATVDTQIKQMVSQNVQDFDTNR